MTITYIDTSAAVKLVFREAETDALKTYFAANSVQTLCAAGLLHTELHCAAGRRGTVSVELLSGVLAVVGLVDLIRGDFVAAGTLAPLRAPDTLHLAVAMRLGADEMVTYDRELADAAGRAGLRVVSPGATQS